MQAGNHPSVLRASKLFEVPAGYDFDLLNVYSASRPQTPAGGSKFEIARPGVTVSDKEQIQTLSAEVKPLDELLQYQDGSIVSRVLLKNKGGTVTLFAFDRGEGLSEHTAPFEALVFVTDGEAEVAIAGKVHSVRQGETITLPANIPHAVKAATRFKMLLTMIRT